MKDMGEKLGRTLAIALLVGAGSVISAVSAVPDCLQAAEAASAAAERQEHIQEVAGNALVTVRQHNVALRDYQGRELHTGKYLELAAKPGASHALRRSLARWNDAERTRWAGDEKMLRNAVHFTEENGIPMYAPYYMGHAIAGWGRVDDAAVDSAVIERYRAVSQDENGDYTFEKREAFAAELIEDGDYRYFLTGGVATEANHGDYGWDRVYFVGYDASGAEVLRYEIERQMSTSFA